MKNRLFNDFIRKTSHRKGTNDVLELICLNGNDVITAKVSDHHPLIHDGVLFWNMMMQGKERKGDNGKSYNNGLGIIENNDEYMKRLLKVAEVIKEIVLHNPTIEIISLCEGPINPQHVEMFLLSLKEAHSMKKFFKDSVTEDQFHQPRMNNKSAWGLLMLANKKYQVQALECDLLSQSELFKTLANRLQLWKLVDEHNTRYLVLAHFPFGHDEFVTKKEELSVQGSMYSQLVRNLLKQHENDSLIFCADFNFNPHLISDDRLLDQITNHNSILLTRAAPKEPLTVKTVTVDGILLSHNERQKYYHSKSHQGLFFQLTKEEKIFKTQLESDLEKNRHNDENAQREYDKRFGLVLSPVVTT